MLYNDESINYLMILECWKFFYCFPFLGQDDHCGGGANCPKSRSNLLNFKFCRWRLWSRLFSSRQFLCQHFSSNSCPSWHPPKLPSHSSWAADLPNFTATIHAQGLIKICKFRYLNSTIFKKSWKILFQTFKLRPYNWMLKLCH